jgi:sugar lactone lactonase YvrE
MADPSLPVVALESVGRNLHRPECVLATSDGSLFVPDWPNAVTTIRPDGTQHTWRAVPAGPAFGPNGIALAEDGSFLIANLGDAGGVWRLRRDGSIEPFVVEVDGIAVPPANFVTFDDRGRVWISVSTRHAPRQLAWRGDVADGFIVLVDRHGARVVADGLCYTNEVRPDPSGRWLYVVETYGRRLRRFRIEPDGNLADPEVVFSDRNGFFPDGLAFDERGGIWITSLISNRLLRLDGDRAETVLEDVNPLFVETVEQAFRTASMQQDHLGPIPGTRIQQLTSLAFGGADRCTAYLGSLHGDCLLCFRAPVSGVSPVHWRYDPNR